MKSITETFGYDSQNRLTGVWPHAMDAATTAEGVFPATAQTVAYTGFDKVSKVKQGNDSICYTYGYDQQRIFMEEHVGNATRTKRYVGNCEYITETNGNITDTQWLTYLSGPLGVFAVYDGHIQPAGKGMYYVHPDHLGSWTTVTNRNGLVLQDVYFDPWGTPYYSDAATPTVASSLLFDRGFTGHEHMMPLGLINMNGRVYDPVTSTFLSVDNFVQDPGSTQNFNRYAYCLNNPLKYTDPDGDLFGTISGLVSDAIYNLFFKSNQDEGWDWSRTKNGWSIDIGLLETDPNKSGWGRFWEVVSRFTWQLPQTMVGYKFAWVSNCFGQVDKVEYYGGTTVSIGNNYGKGGAVTLGNYINGSGDLHARPDNPLFQHEYGHYLQSQAVGPFYLSRYGIPSGLNCLGGKDHDYHPVEQDANIRAFKYFNKKIDGFSDWKFYKNPIVGYENTLPITDEGNQAALRNGRLQPAWYDYLFSLSPLADGLTNPMTGGLINPMAGGLFKIMKGGLLNWWFLEDYEKY